MCKPNKRQLMRQVIRKGTEENKGKVRQVIRQGYNKASPKERIHQLSTTLFIYIRTLLDTLPRNYQK